MHVVAFAMIALLSVPLAAPTAAPTAAPGRAEAAAVTLAPKTAADLTTGLSPLWLRKADLASVDVETTAAGVRVKLTWRADKTGPSAILVAIRPANIADAKRAIQKIASSATPPPRSEANELFAMIDPQGN